MPIRLQPVDVYLFKNSIRDMLKWLETNDCDKIRVELECMLKVCEQTEKRN